MSETLRDLVVSLSLQTDNFTRNIKSVGKQIQEAESTFKLAAAGVEGFERTTTGLATQLSTLERRLSLQKDAVTQYQRALEAANNKLSECYNRQNDYAQRLDDAKKAQQALKEQVAAAAQQVKTYSATLGENDSATIAAKANLDALKVEYRASVQEVKKLSGQNEALKKTTQNAADAVSQANTNLNMARAGVKQTEAEIARCNQSLRLAQTSWDVAGKSIDESRAAIVTFGKQIGLAESRFKLATAKSAWTAAGKSLESFGKTCDSVSKTMTTAGRTLSTVLTAPIVALGTTAVKASLDFESSFAGVRKTVDATEAEFVNLSSASKQMSTEIAASTSEINEVMATGGQLGIANEHLTEFNLLHLNALYRVA